MLKRNILIGTRLFFGLLTLAAIGTQLVLHIQSRFSVVNFFSYFTNLSNIFASVVMVVGALFLIQGRRPTLTDDIIRGTSVVCMALVGIVFSILLRNEDLGNLLPWVNNVVHYIMPIVVVLDWLFQPPQSELAVKQITYWLIFPLIYLIYSIVRGAVVGFYAYPFFNPDKVGGYGGAFIYSVAILAVFLVVSWFLLKLGNKLRPNSI
jgi:hypothetical protein